MACSVRDCKETVQLKYLASHEAACPRRRQPCRWCSDLIVVGEALGHEAACTRRLVPCPNDCGAMLPFAGAAGAAGAGSGAGYNASTSAAESHAAHDCLAFLKQQRDAAEAHARHWRNLYCGGASLASARVLQTPGPKPPTGLLVRIAGLGGSGDPASLFPFNVYDEMTMFSIFSWGDMFTPLLKALKLVPPVAELATATLFDKACAPGDGLPTLEAQLDASGDAPAVGETLALKSDVELPLFGGRQDSVLVRLTLKPGKCHRHFRHLGAPSPPAECVKWTRA